MTILKVIDSELDFLTIRASGPGGQRVNKVETAVQIRFDINTSSLPEWTKKRLLKFKDHRISKDGVILIKSQRHRSQEKNKQDARDRLQSLIEKATKVEKTRIATKPSRSAKKRRTVNKKRNASKKGLRQKPNIE